MPIDVSSQGMDDRPGAFRHRRIEKISAYRRRWMDPKEQNKSRRHQRATADAGHSNQDANTEAKTDDCSVVDVQVKSSVTRRVRPEGYRIPTGKVIKLGGGGGGQISMADPAAPTAAE